MDLEGIEDGKLSPEYLKETLDKAIVNTGASILDFVEFEFEPQGYSINILIAESHASAHTFPEHAAVFIDYFTCGEIEVTKFVSYILSELKPEKAVIRTVVRGNVND